MDESMYACKSICMYVCMYGHTQMHVYARASPQMTMNMVLCMCIYLHTAGHHIETCANTNIRTDGYMVSANTNLPTVACRGIGFKYDAT